MFHVKPFLSILFLFPIVAFSQHFGTTTLAIKVLPALPAKDVRIIQFLSANKDYNSLKPTIKEWFYWTNYSRNNPKGFWDSVVFPILMLYPDLKSSNTLSLERDLIKTSPLPLLTPSQKLLPVAQSFANDLSSNHASPSHTSPSGTSFQDRMKAASINNCASENISFGPPNPVLMLVLLYIDQGVPSLGHRHSLLNPSFTEMGIGTANYPDNKAIIIQDFACSQ